MVNVSDLYKNFAVNTAELERVQVSAEELERYRIEPGDLFFFSAAHRKSARVLDGAALLEKSPSPPYLTAMSCAFA